MASEHYPADPGPSDEVRAVAAEILSDLIETPAGFQGGRLPCREHASQATTQRAIQWLQANGIDVQFVRAGQANRWVLRGERRHLPAHALCRVDLLDELRLLLGSDRDPLEAIRELTATRWLVVSSAGRLSLSKREPGHGLVWRCDYHRHRLRLYAAPLVADRADASRMVLVADVEDLDVPRDAVEPFADYQIALHRRSAVAALSTDERRAASW